MGSCQPVNAFKGAVLFWHCHHISPTCNWENGRRPTRSPHDVKFQSFEPTMRLAKADLVRASGKKRPFASCGSEFCWSRFDLECLKFEGHFDCGLSWVENQQTYGWAKLQSFRRGRRNSEGFGFVKVLLSCWAVSFFSRTDQNVGCKMHREALFYVLQTDSLLLVFLHIGSLQGRWR